MIYSSHKMKSDFLLNVADYARAARAKLPRDVLITMKAERWMR